MKTRSCTPATIQGRLRKARQFADTAELLSPDESLGDACATNCIHAGIAASDVICCCALGEHAIGDSHSEAVKLLATVVPGGRDLAKDLQRLLGLKTRAGYGYESVTHGDVTKAERYMGRLLAVAEERASIV